MLDVIGVNQIEDLFDEIPDELRCGPLSLVPDGINEMELNQLMVQFADQDGRYVNFIGAGVYEHHIPAAVWELTTRGEYYTAYTPYQAEASQGTLQLLYEYQSMMASLTGMDVSNASMYEGASALAEAVLAAVRSQRKRRAILLPRSINPVYRQVVEAIVKNQRIELIDVPVTEHGVTDLQVLEQYADHELAALVIPQPNYFGRLEPVDELTNWAHGTGALVIGLVNPIACGILVPPGQWGEVGADFAVGEGQPLGVPMSSGGPYYGFMCCKQKQVRQMPGRIVGRTVDADGKDAYTLTLQAREQHIRRSKATSNICTNQGLMVTASTIHMAMIGPQGLAQVAHQCHQNTRYLLELLTAIDGVDLVFEGPVFHEAVLQLSCPVADVLASLEAQGIVGGKDISAEYPELGDVLLVCSTEVRTKQQMQNYAFHLERVISKQRLDPPRAVKGMK